MVASLGCVICRRDQGIIVPPDVHHIAQGSGKRSHFMTAGLCKRHHVSSIEGLHGAGVKAFLRMHNLPTEFHLLGLVNNFRAADKI